MLKTVILVPDSFKGTLSSPEICEIVGGVIREQCPDCRVVPIPVADGGEGSVECFLTALSGERVSCTVTGPRFEPMTASYGLLENGRTAIIEMAACAGLPLVEADPDPTATTTYGVGELMLDAARRGCRRIIVGLGGSCTNDGGTGAAAAVGVRFLREDGTAFVPVGGTLREIRRIDCREKSPLLDGVEIVTMCDIDNPMYGENGAAYVFAPQKGADAAAVRELDGQLRHLCDRVREDLHRDLAALPGGGAAGAMGAGMVAFFDARLQMGIETVLDTVGFDRLLTDADLVITGEGKLDAQSLRGKVVMGVARRAKKSGVPVVVIAGGVEDAGLDRAYDEGVTAAFSLNRLPEDFSVSRYHSRENLRYTAANILRLYRAADRP